MQKNSVKIVMIVLVFFLSFIFISGCAKKSAIKDASVTNMEESAAKKQAAVAVDKGVAAPAEEKVKPQDMLVEKGLSEDALRKQAEQQKQLKEGEQIAKTPEQEMVKKEALFENIHFDFDMFNLTPKSRQILEEVANFLNNNTKYIIRVEGHCDERGTAEYNLALGQRRADEAMNYLVKLGIADERITALSYGKELPLDPAGSEEAWAKNRRANFVLILTK